MRYFFLLSLFLIENGAFAQLADRNYSDLLTKSIRFFDAQACGPKPSFSTFGWRGNCHLDDGQNLNLDLTGGWHDAGDHPKFNFPLGAAVYKLASLYVDYREQVRATGNKARLLNQLRFIGDYMIRCHPSPNSYVIQVGEGTVDHRFWQVPEENTYQRISYIADVNKPATDLACVNAAGFAALSMAFRGEDNAYSAELLQHAQDLYNFGTTYRGSFTDHIPSGEVSFYGSNDYRDAMMIGAIWLHRATGDPRYLQTAESIFDEITLGNWVPTFRDHEHEAFMQLAKVTGDSEVLQALDTYVNDVIDANFGDYTSGGLWRPSDGNSFNAHRSISGVSIVYRYAELIGSSNPTYGRAKDFVFNQVNYLLGDNWLGMSYVVSLGNNFPTRVHHRAAHDPVNGSITSPTEDTHTLIGALVAGPNRDDSYDNNRRNIGNTEPTILANATLALVAAAAVKETESAVSDDIVSISAPASVTPGITATVSVKYSASADRDVIVTFQQDSAPFRVYSKVKTDVSAGSGTLSINVPISTTVPVAEDAYQFQVYITTNGGGWAQRLDNLGKKDIDANSGSTGDIPVEVRARVIWGNSGQLELQLNNQAVETLTINTTNFSTYRATLPGGGNVKLFFQDRSNSNLEVDYITVGGATYQAEDQANNTAVWQKGSCGGSYSQQMHCQGHIDFGQLSVSARPAFETKKSLVGDESSAPLLMVYPNPGNIFRVTTEPGTELRVTDLLGREVWRQRAGQKTRIDLSNEPDGVYLLRTAQGQTFKLMKEAN